MGVQINVCTHALGRRPWSRGAAAGDRHRPARVTQFLAATTAVAVAAVAEAIRSRSRSRSPQQTAGPRMAPDFARTTTARMARDTTAHATPLATAAAAGAAASPAVADALRGLGDVERRPEPGGKDGSTSLAFQKPLNTRRAARQTAGGAAAVAGGEPTLVTLVW